MFKGPLSPVTSTDDQNDKLRSNTKNLEEHILTNTKVTSIIHGSVVYVYYQYFINISSINYRCYHQFNFKEAESDTVGEVQLDPVIENEDETGSACDSMISKPCTDKGKKQLC